MYHVNPKIYESSDTPHPFRKELTADDIWKSDKEKKETALYNDYEIMYVWDYEYRKVGVEKKYNIIKNV